MKKLLLFTTALLLCILLCACGNTETQTAAPTETPAPTATPTPNPEAAYADIKIQYPTDGSVGFCLMDLDGDGIRELFVGNLTGDVYEQQVIDAMYTITDGQPVKVLESTGDDKYYLTENETVVKETVQSAFQASYTYYTYANGFLQEMVSVVHDTVTDKDNPWYQEVAGQKEAMDEATAMEFIQAYQGTYQNLEYTD